MCLSVILYPLYSSGCCIILLQLKKKEQELAEEKSNGDQEKITKAPSVDSLSASKNTENQTECDQSTLSSSLREKLKPKKPSDTDEISLIFEDALEYQETDIEDVVADNESIQDGTLNGEKITLINGVDPKYLGSSETSGSTSVICGSDVTGAEGIDERQLDSEIEDGLETATETETEVDESEDEDEDEEHEIMIESPPAYINIPPSMRISQIMAARDLEYRMDSVREEMEMMSGATPGHATIGHGPAPIYYRGGPLPLDPHPSGPLNQAQVEKDSHIEDAASSLFSACVLYNYIVCWFYLI